MTVAKKRIIPAGMTDIDPRTNPYRADIAAAYLQGRVTAAKFVPPVAKAVIVGNAPIRREPRDNAPLDTELQFGERVEIYEDKEGWSWLQSMTDGYVGYTPSDMLGDTPAAPTHTLNVLRSYLFKEPDLKTPPRTVLSMTATVTILEKMNGYCALAGGGWVYARHLVSAREFETDPVTVAHRFLGTPYLWGGKSSIGLDCSALVQLSLARCGLSVPRDTGMQENAIGNPVEFRGDEDIFERGDLVYWPGHVGIWIAADRFIHGNATDMMVAIAPLRDVATSIEDATGDTIRSVRRPVLP